MDKSGDGVITLKELMMTTLSGATEEEVASMLVSLNVGVPKRHQSLMQTNDLTRTTSSVGSTR